MYYKTKNMNPEAFYDIQINDIIIDKLVNENFKKQVEDFIDGINKYIFEGNCVNLDDMVETFIVEAHNIFGDTVMIEDGKREKIPASDKFDYKDLKLDFSKTVYEQLDIHKLNIDNIYASKQLDIRKLNIDNIYVPDKVCVCVCPQDWSDGSTEPPFSQVLFILACVIKFGLNRLEIDSQVVYRKEYDSNPSIYKIDIIKDTGMISCPEIINEIHDPPKKEYVFDCCGNLVTE
jgi:hypothetical protein